MTLLRNRRNEADPDAADSDPARPNDRNPLWFAAYRTRRFLQSWAIVFVSLGFVFTIFWVNAYEEIRAVCDPHKPLGVMAWGPMAAAALSAYGIGIVLFGMARLSDLAQAQHDELKLDASSPEDES